MQELLILTYIVTLILLFVAIYNAIKVKDTKRNLIEEQSKLTEECSKLNKCLTDKIVQINLILYLDKSDTEKIKQIEKVIHSSDQLP